MKRFSQFVVGSLMSGLLIVVPIYLSVLLLLRAMQGVAGMVRPLARLLPEWLADEQLLSLFLLLFVSLLIGIAARGAAGRAARKRLEKALFEKIPGYTLLRSLTQQVAGSAEEQVWKP